MLDGDRRRRCARSRSATARPSAGRRRGSRRSGAGPTLAALVNAPMRMQLRYQGPVDTLWRLSGVELFDLSGPIAIGADISGRLIDPVIRGSLRAQGARLESAVTGTVIDGLHGERAVQRVAAGAERDQRPDARRRDDRRARDDRFRGRLAGDRPRASTRPRRGCSTATIFSAERHRAARDPVAARAAAGRSAATLRLDGGRFTLGRASAASRVPQLERPARRRRSRRGDRGRAAPAVGARPQGGGRRSGRARARHRQPLDDRPRHRRQRRRAALHRRRPSWCAAIMNSPGARSGSTAARSASAAKARSIRCSTFAPRRRSRGSMPR